MLLVVQSSPFYALKRVVAMILLQQEWGLQMTCRFLCVVALRVSFPFDKVLQLFSSSMMSVAVDGLDFILFFVVHKVQGWSRIVLPMFYCFDIWGKK